MDYCFYINDEYWFAAQGRTEGHICAHCILQKLGGLDWYIVLAEPIGKTMGRWPDPVGVKTDAEIHQPATHQKPKG
jgi:hypothetical protein